MAGTSIQKAEPKQELGIAGFLNLPEVRKNIEGVVGGGTSTFISGVVSAVQTNPELAKCTKSSILSSALLGESLKLSPSPQLGNYYLVPYKNNKSGEAEAQFQLGYKGMIQLAIRSGEYKNIVVNAVKEGELISYNPLTEEFAFNPCLDPSKRAKLKVIGYYAMFELNSGFRKEIYMSKEDMEAHATRYSAGYRAKKGYTFWEKDFDGMAYKTMLRKLLSKWGIMSVEMQRAYEGDQAVVREDGSLDYVDNIENPIETRDADVKEANGQVFVDADATVVEETDADGQMSIK